MQDPVTSLLQKLLVMCYHQHDAALSGQIPDHAGHLHHPGIIQAAGGLVKISTGFSDSSAVATASRCFCPPESAMGCRSRKDSS